MFLEWILFFYLPPPPPQVVVYAEMVQLDRRDEYVCLAEIFQRESSWDPNAVGDLARGGSYGLPQRHAPAHGMPPWPWPIADQVEWALDYADTRYGGPCQAWERWQERAKARGGRGWW